MASPTETLYPKARPRARSARWLAPLLRSYYRLRATLLHPVNAPHTVTEHLRGLTLTIHPTVLNPAAVLTSHLMLDAIDTLNLRPGQRLLELGTGCGLAALHAAKSGAHVTATDLNPAAITCARENAARLNLPQQIDFRQGDLFAPVQGEHFDTILFHPPYFPGPQTTSAAAAWHYADLPTRFAAELNNHLTPNGRALLLLSTNGDCAPYLCALQSAGFTPQIVLEKELHVELAVIYSVQETKPNV